MNTREFFKTLGLGGVAITIGAPLALIAQSTKEIPQPKRFFSVDIMRLSPLGEYVITKKQPWNAIQEGDYYRHIPNQDGIMPTLCIPGWLRADKIMNVGSMHLVTVGFPNKFNKGWPNKLNKNS